MMRPSRPFVGGCLTGAALGIVVLVAGLFVAAQFMKDRLVANKTAQLAPPPGLVQTQANLDWSAEELSGAPFPMDQLKGKALFLHFWHPGCLSCQSEIQALNGLHAALAGSGVAMATVVVNDFDDAAETMSKYGIQYPVYLMRQKLPEPFVFTATPATYLISPSGAVVYSHLGAAQWDAPGTAALLRALEALPAS